MTALSAAYYGGLRALGVPALNRRLQDAGLILCYHNVVPDRDEGGGGEGLHLSAARFERQVRWLADRYTVVPLPELIDRLLSGRSLRKVAALTFDDGYAGVFEAAVPILEAHSIPATIFLVSDAVGRATGFWWDQPRVLDSITPARRQRWLTEERGDGDVILAGLEDGARPLRPAHQPAGWSLIRARLGPGIDLGSHSATHRSLPRLTDDQLAREVVASREAIHQATGRRPQLFAYPYGHWDRRVLEHVRAAGYRAALTLDDGLNRRTADPWSLRRVNVPAGISDAAFEAWTAGLAAPRRQ